MAERGTGRVGVRDVARLAGVSTQTVSRVINDQPNIREDTRRRVQEAIATLGYRVNNAARTLGTSSTRTIGVIASDATLYGPAVGIAALERAARDVGRWIATAYADAADDASLDAAVVHALAQGVDGLILIAPHATALERLIARDPGVPVSALHGGVGEVRQREGAQSAVDHLVAIGHRRIGRLAGPAEWAEEVAREEGHCRALARAGMPGGPKWAGDWSAASGAARAPQVAAAIRSGAVSAVVVANDQMALGLMSGLAEADIRVPADVSIVGWDDNPDAAFYRPALTTVRLDVAGEARRCVAGVIAPNTDAPEHTLDQVGAARLIVRGSSAAPTAS